MMKINKTLCLIASLGALTVGAVAGAQGTDTLSLDDVKTAASAKFDKLNKDSDSTLDANEVKGLIGEKSFKLADPDNDGTLDKNEYLALVEKLFKRADVDHDGTVDATELKGPNGRMLKRLVR
jgi:uncharacterized membrane protein YkoI